MKNLFLPQNLIRKVLITFLFITSAMFYAQLEKTYVSSQTNQNYGVCLLCSIDNPQNIVGNNENNYETLRIPVGLYGRIEQNLNFPKLARAYRKVTMGIETPNVSIKEQAKREIYIETFKGNISNNDRIRVDTTMLKPSSNSQKGTIEFTTTRPFDRIRLSVHSGLIGVGEELRIYYVHHLPAPFTTCGNPPLDPLYYYPFDGNGKDIISENNLSLSTETTFQNDAICKEAVYSDSSASLENVSIPLNGSKTYSFWLKMDGGTIPAAFDMRMSTIYITTEVPGFITAGHISSNIPKSITADQFYHFTLVYNENFHSFCFYKNGELESEMGVSPCIDDNTPFIFQSINILLKRSKMDEFLVYDRALTSDEVKALTCSYGILPNCSSGTSAPASKIATPAETFTISPNPTTGEITLDGNILLVGSDISIRNISGMEVYHSPFRSKTFELPTTLPGGVYMLTLQTKDKKIYTRKIILTR